jgi:hypothetical protein
VPFAFVKNVVQIAFLPQWTLIYDCGFFIPKVPLETGASPTVFDASYAPGCDSCFKFFWFQV